MIEYWLYLEGDDDAIQPVFADDLDDAIEKIENDYKIKLVPWRRNNDPILARGNITLPIVGTNTYNLYLREEAIKRDHARGHFSNYAWLRRVQPGTLLAKTEAPGVMTPEAFEELVEKKKDEQKTHRDAGSLAFGEIEKFWAPEDMRELEPPVEAQRAYKELGGTGCDIEMLRELIMKLGCIELIKRLSERFEETEMKVGFVKYNPEKKEEGDRI